MKNPNGYGSVYKLSGNRRRPWIARVTTGWSNEGKQQYYTIGYFETRREGMEALAEYHKNPIAERGDVTLAEIYTEWSGSRFPKLAHKTVRSYETAWDNHLNKLGHHKIKDIKTSHLQNIINDMAEKGLSRSSCHKVKVLANQLFKYAMADDIVNKNYTEFVKLPKETKSKQQEVFTDMEIRTLFKNEHVKWVDTILIFIYTGMRISEFLSITKFNVDMQNMIITGGIKTDAGRDRVIPIHPKIQKYISKWYNTDSEYLISRNGEKIKPNYYRRYIYYPTLEKLGIRKLTPHKARHTFASLLNKAGADTKSIQEIMGHTDYSTTANIYTHVDVEKLRKAIEKIK